MLFYNFVVEISLLNINSLYVLPARLRLHLEE